jgi:hypothetical protein
MAHTDRVFQHLADVAQPFMNRRYPQVTPLHPSTKRFAVGMGKANQRTRTEQLD